MSAFKANIAITFFKIILFLNPLHLADVGDFTSNVISFADVSLKLKSVMLYLL